MINKSSSLLLYRYISKEFLSNFLVAFIFFFMIFFVNSILLLVQRILLRNIDFMTMLTMVLLSMPQFLIYTLPFATLSGSSMVLGDLSSNNELLALKSSGIRQGKVFIPIIIWSLIFSLLTYYVSDYLLPWSNIIYRERLTLLMRDMPTFEIEANGTNTIGNIVIANGETDGNSIYDIVMTNSDRTDENKSVVSRKGTVELSDPVSFIYNLRLESPDILITNSSDINTNLIAKAESATFNLNFSDQVPTLTSTNPVNLSSRVLWENIEIRRERENNDRITFHNNREDQKLRLSEALKANFTSDEDTLYIIEEVNASLFRYGREPIDFFSQYYKAELGKKFSLSLACFFLTLVSLPLGTMKVRYGKLTGFALSLIVAVAYWYLMFFAQLQIFNISSDPYFLIFTPDFAVGLLALLLAFFARGRRK